MGRSLPSQQPASRERRTRESGTTYRLLGHTLGDLLLPARTLSPKYPPLPANVIMGKNPLALTTN